MSHQKNAHNPTPLPWGSARTTAPLHHLSALNPTSCLQDKLPAEAAEAFPPDAAPPEGATAPRHPSGLPLSLSLHLSNSNFAALEEDDADSDPAAVPTTPERGGGAASAAVTPGAGHQAGAAARKASDRVDWRLGYPAGADEEGLAGLSAPSAGAAAGAAQKGAAEAPLAAEDAAQRGLFATLGHLYASARVELIRLADALSLESHFTGEDCAGDSAPGAPGGSSPRGPRGRPSSRKWLSPMRLPVKGATTGPSGPSSLSGAPDGSAGRARRASRMRPEGDAPANGVVLETASVSESGDSSSMSDAAGTFMPTPHGLLLHSDPRFIERAVRCCCPKPKA